MADALGAMIERLRAAEVRNRRFVADVSHELRTPLTALVAEAGVLAESLDALPPEAGRAGELLVADVARMRTLVEDLMELSRFDAGAEQVAASPSTSRLASGRWRSRGSPAASLEIDPGSLAARPTCGRIGSSATCHNVRSSAGRSGDPGPGPDRATAEVRVTVADRDWVPPAELARIFERFAMRTLPGPAAADLTRHRPRARDPPRRVPDRDGQSRRARSSFAPCTELPEPALACPVAELGTRRRCRRTDSTAAPVSSRTT
jgi:hypothetical protein